MKEKILEKAEMKESLLSGEALALNDAELEGAAGGISMSEIAAEMEQRYAAEDNASYNELREEMSELVRTIDEKAPDPSAADMDPVLARKHRMLMESIGWRE